MMNIFKKTTFPFVFRHFYLLALVISLGSLFVSCEKEEPVKRRNSAPVDPTESTDPETFDFSRFPDDYSHIHTFDQRDLWGFYNVHDPAILKDGSYYYAYSTDASFGNVIGPGIQMRRSKDLINWEFLGLAFDGIPEKGAQFIKSNGATPFESLWAPYVYKSGSEYRLYYSLSSEIGRLSVIGLATASTPRGPWTEKGIAVASVPQGVGTNAIDPSVIIDQAGRHWFYYGSAWDGIYILELNPATGLAMTSGDKGKRIAQRGSTNGQINGNIEGPEIIYSEEQQKYYLFISYDWLETKYNVRVGRSDSPEGPFLDYNGVDMNEETDNIPMILAPYKFNNHVGYQGVSHPGVFKDGAGQFFMATQARPTNGVFFMTMHIRKMYWTEDGWPVVSPERYGALPSQAVANEDLVGSWERIVFNYRIVPGYAEEQTSPDLQTSVLISLQADGSINDDANNQWSFEEPWLTLSWNNGEFVDKVRVDWARDWENKILRTLIFTGLDEKGTAVWGKKRANN